MDGEALLEAGVGRVDRRLAAVDAAGGLAAESESRAPITSELRGRTLLLRYSWRFDDDEHEGLALIGRNDDGVVEMA